VWIVATIAGLLAATVFCTLWLLGRH